MFGNLLKAAVGVVVTPIAVVVDVVTLPSTAFENKDAFHRTGNLLNSVGDNIMKAVSDK